ncbi:MAG: DUF924 domain-containing protein [Rhodospirillaceae bacterium]|jgi:uncharacterized protein (DUF924 family)|nr:DUF924 domain-containing protein [Rhodospirillaceae bacterium]MBT5664285.1 DUF924 domain-containing protein [Rhodospirillaceae bacterium]MBT5812398.1 DUF924 domain-containing protein [Rhodospirillaceae bacterium]
MTMDEDLIEAVHGFWFGPPPYERRAVWFEQDPVFDADIKTRFGDVWAQATSGAFDHVAGTARGRLALLIVLDQFSRNLHRGDARAFSNDAKALALAKAGIDEGHDREITQIERVFMYLPFEHSEDLAEQNRMMELCAHLPESNLEWAQKHLVIIERFGRFPHRNEALGRTTTPEEAAFLLESDSSF